ncbi:MAG TPA: hypothetical protein PK906_16745 [Spirochaetota bacterium]|nr:hypothetical protein [Spirochaetota bacterium]
MAEGGFDFKKLVDETKATLIAPAEYFTVMPKEGGISCKGCYLFIHSGTFHFFMGSS